MVTRLDIFLKGCGNKFSFKSSHKCVATFRAILSQTPVATFGQFLNFNISSHWCLKTCYVFCSYELGNSENEND